MIVLGIDTSFDDTAAAVVSGKTILSNVTISQIESFAAYGGVVPSIARKQHQEHLDRVISRALSRAGITWKKIDAIAVTRGPGLAISLEIGIEKAKELAALHAKKLLAINHMEGHLLSFFAKPKQQKGKPMSDPKDKDIFPFLGVLVSGGHTQFVYAADLGKYDIVGETQDDAIGEAYDKVGRMLGLGYPAGAIVERMARDGNPNAVVFPVPMRQVQSADTSYSGLKTAALRIIERYEKLSRQDVADIALGFQTAAITHVVEKCAFALRERNVRALVLGGGVAANLALRKALRQLAKKQKIALYLPYTKKLCVDNAAMIALAGSLHAERGVFSDSGELDRLPNMRLDH